jgi:hypothetical protein
MANLFFPSEVRYFSGGEKPAARAWLTGSPGEAA